MAPPTRPFTSHARSSPLAASCVGSVTAAPRSAAAATALAAAAVGVGHAAKHDVNAAGSAPCTMRVTAVHGGFPLPCKKDWAYSIAFCRSLRPALRPTHTHSCCGVTSR